MSRIRRSPRTTHFTVLHNEVIEDDLSWEALGMLTYLLSKPDDWLVKTEHLVRVRGAGRDKVRRILKEIEQAGYLVRRQYRNEDGTFGWESILYDVPQEASAGNSTDGLSVDGLSVAGSSDVGSSDVDKHVDLTKTDETKTDERKTEIDIYARAIKHFEEVFPDERLTIYRLEQIKAKIKDPGRWREVLEEWKLNNYQSHMVGSMIQRYEQQVARTQRRAPDVRSTRKRDYNV